MRPSCPCTYSAAHPLHLRTPQTFLWFIPTLLCGPQQFFGVTCRPQQISCFVDTDKFHFTSNFVCVYTSNEYLPPTQFISLGGRLLGGGMPVQTSSSRAATSSSLTRSPSSPAAARGPCTTSRPSSGRTRRATAPPWTDQLVAGLMCTSHASCRQCDRPRYAVPPCTFCQC